MWTAGPSVFLLLFFAPLSGAQIPLNPEGGQHSCGQCVDSADNDQFICGSDGRTYTPCELRHAQCLGYRVELSHIGKCSGNRCLAQQAQARAHEYLFVPDCNADGTFKPIQCHEETGHCWCVDSDGKILAGSTVSHRKPNCKKYACSPNERSTFNTNLMNALMKEFSSTNPSAEATSAKAAEEKFLQLDKNNDSSLMPTEYKDFKRLLKRIILPRVCARIFVKLTDTDGDEIISLKEWTASLGLEDGSEKDHTESPEETITFETFAEETEELVESEPTEEASRETEDCSAARQTALERQKVGNIYIPECSSDGGTYKEQQCHLEICWCVALKSGKPIHGTAHNKTMVADCSSAKLKAKTLRGCPIKKKKLFTDNLASMFYMQKNASVTLESAQSSINSSSARNETLSWKFTSLDLNQSGRLEREEWKLFRREWKNTVVLNAVVKRQQRKCWRNIIKFCDENEDKLVTRDEWMQCVGPTMLQDRISHERRGKNPFVDILKS